MYADCQRTQDDNIPRYRKTPTGNSTLQVPTISSVPLPFPPNQFLLHFIFMYAFIFPGAKIVLVLNVTLKTCSCIRGRLKQLFSRAEGIARHTYRPVIRSQTRATLRG